VTPAISEFDASQDLRIKRFGLRDVVRPGFDDDADVSRTMVVVSVVRRPTTITLPGIC